MRVREAEPVVENWVLPTKGQPMINQSDLTPATRTPPVPVPPVRRRRIIQYRQYLLR